MLFEGNERKELENRMRAEHRLPPGQSATLKWPVLHYGSIPHFDPATWDFRLWGLVENPLRLSWAEFNALPKTAVTRDFHCVTRWSRFDNHWEGVGFREVLRLVRLKPGAAYVLVLPSRDIRRMSRWPIWIATTSCLRHSTMASRSRPSTAIRCGW